MQRSLYRDELVGADLLWLVEVELGGRVYRWSSEPLDVVSDDGTLRYDGGLDALEVTDELDLFARSPDQLSITLDLLWPAAVAAEVQRGHDLARARAEVALLIRGSTYEDRRVIIQGTLQDPIYAEDGTPVSASCVDLPYDDQATWPPATHKVTPQTWPSHDASAANAVYPQVFGRPGYFLKADGTVGGIGGSPALQVDATKLLIAGHPVGAVKCDVFFEGGSEANLDVVEERDALGVLCSVVTVAASTISSGAGAWTIALKAGGGLPRTPSAALDRLGDVLGWWLDRSSLRVDRAAWSSVAGYLNRWTVAGYVDEEVEPWAFLVDNLLPLAPVAVQGGPDGARPVVYRWSSGRIVERLDGGAAGVERSRVEIDSQDLVAEVRLSWAQDPAERTHRRQTTLLPRKTQAESSATLSEDQLCSLWASTSLDRYGPGRAASLETDWLADAASAGLTLAWRSLIEGLPHRLISYDVDQSFAWLALGDRLALTAAELSLVDEPALVVGLTLRDSGRIGLALRLLGDPGYAGVNGGPNGTTNYQDSTGV